MNHVFNIRRATPADADIIVTQRRQMFEDMGYRDSRMLDSMDEKFAVWLRDRLAREVYLGWFALTPDEQIVAGVGLWLLDWPPGPLDQSSLRGYVLNVYTAPDYRYRGLASKLMQTLLEWCRAQGIHTISLHASDQGRSVYEHLDFKPTNEMRLFWP